MKIEDKITQALGYWQEILGLEDWDITVEFTDLSAAKSVAEVTPNDMYDAAKIKFDPKALKGESDSYIERTVIHELLHLHDRDRNFIFMEIESNLNPEVYKLFDNIIYQHTEAQIDRLATILYKLNQKALTKKKG